LKSKIYIKTPSDIPQGKKVEQGPEGGYYYESEGMQKPIEQKPLSDNEKIELINNTNDQNILHQMINDKNVNIRYEVVKRINMSGLHQMINDENPFIRVEIVERIDMNGLHQMMNDENANIRVEVIKRIDMDGLYQMMNDENPNIRINIAKRIDMNGLHQMMNDEKDYIRVEVAKRIDMNGLYQMMRDEDLSIREEVVERIDMNGLQQMMNDENINVRGKVAKRINIINKISSIIENYNKTHNIELTSEYKNEIKNIMDSNFNSILLIEMSNEFYNEIDDGKFSSWHHLSKESWEQSSSSDLALLLKNSVKKQFGGEIVYHSYMKNINKKLNELYQTYPLELVDEYIKIQKQLTRKFLDAMFPSTDLITIYRGTTEHEAHQIGNNKKVNMRSNPVSSWTLKENVAKNFGRIVIKTNVHKDEIWSTFMTHAYQGNEREILLIGNKDREGEII